MTLHLFYKEWIKTRWAFLCMLLLGICAIFYIFTGVENRITMIGAKNYMLRVLYDDPQIIYYSLFRFIPFLLALSIGITQYVPEVMQKRIRLTLHLPCRNNQLIATMVGFGLLLLTLGNGIYTGILLYCNVRIFPAEITGPVMTSIMPWLLGSYMTYNFIAMIAMEPNRWRQVIYAIIAWYIVNLFLMKGNVHGAYAASLPVMLILLLASSCLVLYSAYRFYKGEK